MFEIYEKRKKEIYLLLIDYLMINWRIMLNTVYLLEYKNVQLINLLVTFSTRFNFNWNSVYEDNDFQRLKVNKNLFD